MERSPAASSAALCCTSAAHCALAVCALCHGRPSYCTSCWTRPLAVPATGSLALTESISQSWVSRSLVVDFLPESPCSGELPLMTRGLVEDVSADNVHVPNRPMLKS